MPKISILVPAFNEEATIVDLLTRVNEQQVDGFDLEVIVVDDGSQDRTVPLLEENPELYATLVRQPQNGGKGAAVQAGLRAATGDYVLFQDADLEYDPSEYKDLFFPVKSFNSDIVMGSRFMAPKFSRGAYFWHKVGNRFITLLFNVFHNTTFTDIYSCYLMFRRKLINPEELKTFGWEQQAEILSLVSRRSKVIYEVPISYHGRTYEEGKKIRAHHILGVLRAIATTRLFRS